MCVCAYFECAAGHAYLCTCACLHFWKYFVILDDVYRYVACMFSYVHEYLTLTFPVHLCTEYALHGYQHVSVKICVVMCT